MSDIRIEAHSATPTNTGVEGGLDVGIDIRDLDGEISDLSGEVTMVPDRANGGWRSYGDDPALWVEAEFLRSLRERYPHTLRETLEMISASAADVCALYPRPVGRVKGW